MNGSDLEKSWKECLTAWEDSSPAQRADCRAFAVNLRDSFVRVLRDVDDAQEQETIASIFYTQVKCQWILINTQSGYQISQGRIEGTLFCRAGMLSALLGALEPVLRKVDLTRITNFLAEPEGNSHENNPDAARLSALLGTRVEFEEVPAEMQSFPRIIVDAKVIENRFRELSAQFDEGEQQWKELQADLGVDNRTEIVALFEKLQSTDVMSEEAGSDAAISRAAHAEWAERRELQLRALRKEIGTLRADWEQIHIETGITEVSGLISSWREAKDTLKAVRSKLAVESSALAALRAEYGADVSAAEVIAEMRRLSSELSQVQTKWEKLRIENEYLEREFGTFNAQQMVELVRSLRDKIAEVSTQSVSGNVDHDGLIQEFGTADLETIVVRVRELRDNLAAATREMIPLRADRYVLQNELGKSDAREIVAHMRTLEMRIQSFSEMSELLGSMEQALKTLD
ncbi:MAG: hypothetical protein H7145_23095 [Akkermansiaceae bacterium]|nr:hypothetical protein [Armatimonadota bacterium]